MIRSPFLRGFVYRGLWTYKYAAIAAVAIAAGWGLGKLCNWLALRWVVERWGR